MLLALLVVLLSLSSAYAQTTPQPQTRIQWYLTAEDFTNVNSVIVTASPDLNGDCVAEYISQPQFAPNVELAASVGLSASGGLRMQGWALQGNENYVGADLTLSAREVFSATATGELPANLALQLNLKIDGMVNIAGKVTGMCGPFWPRGNYINFTISIRDSSNVQLARWNGTDNKTTPRLTLAASTNDDCSIVNYGLVQNNLVPSDHPIVPYDNGCSEEICLDTDTDVIDWRIPFDGAGVSFSLTPTLTLPNFEPGKVYLLTLSVQEVMDGMGALDLWNTIEFGETPFVFGTLDGGTFTPLSSEDQAKIVLNSATGSMQSPNAYVDVKPGGYPNIINRTSQGVIKGAILGTADLDVTQIDPTSVRLAGVAGIRWSIEDVGTPCGDCTESNCVEPDGLNDLVVTFKTEEIAEKFVGFDEKSDIKIWMTGSLKGEYGGNPVRGYDIVSIVK